MNVANWPANGDVGPHCRLMLEACRQRGRRRLDGDALTPLSDDRYRQRVLDVAAEHRVLGLTLTSLTEALEGRDDPSAGGLGDLLRKVRRRSALFDLRRERVTVLLEQAGVAAVVLKGGATSVLYFDAPHERDLEDLDLLVSENDVDRAVDTLRAAGYDPPYTAGQIETFRRHHFHIPMRHPDRHEVEVHWGLSRPTSTFRLDAGEVVRAAREHARPGRPPLRHPSPEHTILHDVLQNLQESFCRLARFVEIDRIVARVPDLDWDRVIRAARDGGLANPTVVSLRIAGELLGTAVPPEVFRALAPPGPTRFHIAIMRPAALVLTQRLGATFAAQHLHEFWMCASHRDRRLLLSRLLTRDPEAGLFTSNRPGMPKRWWNIGKLALLQMALYVDATILALTRGGRAQMRFWSSHSSSSDFL